MIAFRELLRVAVGVVVLIGCAAEHPGVPMTPRADEPATATDYAQETSRQVDRPDEIVTTLRSGLVVIAKRVPSPVVSVRAYALTGGVYEGKWLGGGLSHLLEHLVAGCSNARRTEEQNRDLLQAIGNNSNAYTDYGHTCYYVNTTPQHLDQAVDLVAGWMFTCQIAAPEYRREYEVVQRELEKDRGEPDQVFALLGMSNRYRVSPARVPVIGYQEVIQSLSRDDVYSYYQVAYQPNNMVFAIAGDLPAADMLKAVQKQVGSFPPGRVFSHDIASEPQVTSPRTVVATFPKLGRAKLELAFPTVGLDHDDVYALDLLAAVVGGGESSILVEELRDRRRLVDDVDASSFTPEYASGTFAIDMTLEDQKLRDAAQATLEIINKIKSQGVDADSLARAKAQMRAAQIMSMQTCDDVISQMAVDYIVTGDPHYQDQYIQRIQTLSSDDLRNVARKYLDSARLLTTAMVPTESQAGSGLPKAEDRLRREVSKPSESGDVSSSDVTRTELPNGVIFLHKRIGGTQIVRTFMVALGGLTAEDEKTNGLGHLTMDMLPRGTKTRSSVEIARALDAMGAGISTSCSANYWSWSASCLKPDFQRTIELFGDIANNPAFADAELENVKEWTLGEIDAQDSDWFAQSQRFFKQAFFGPMKSPYRFMAIGTAENVERAASDDVRRWYETKVTTAPRVLAIFGDVDRAEAQAMARRYFGGGPKLTSPGPTRAGVAPVVPPDPRVPTIDVTRVEMQKTDQPLAGIVIGFQSDSTIVPDAQTAAMTLADCLVSGYAGPTGYLFDTLRGRGLVYEVDADDRPGLNASLPGTFMVYAGCDPGKVNEVIDLSLLNIARLQGKDSDIQSGWFDRSKSLVTTADALAHETAAAQAATAALDELYGLGYDHHSGFADRINAVTLAQVRELARRRLTRCVVTVCTPKPDLLVQRSGSRTYDSFPPVELTQPPGVKHDSAGGPR
ncbi:MAG: M16 family metallopeptidase [Tepidisphaeraceae bacterium]